MPLLWLFAGGGDLAHQAGGALDGVGDAARGVAGAIDEFGAGVDGGDGADQFLDLARGGGRALRQAAYFGGDHREALAVLARARLRPRR